MSKLTQTLTAVLLASAASVSVAAADDAAGTILLDVRARYEAVEQTGKLDAEATTVRTRLGWQSPQWRGFTALIEGENIVGIGADNYNSGLNGNTAYAAIKDDDHSELNRLQLCRERKLPCDDRPPASVLQWQPLCRLAVLAPGSQFP